MDVNNIGFDFSTSDLLCNEETEELCFSDGDDDLVERLDHDQSSKSNGQNSGKASYDLLPCLSEECIGWMVERESDHRPRHDYTERLIGGELDVSLRRWSLHWMFKACGRYSYGESCLCAAMTYFDRFLSVYEHPLSSLERVDRKWEIQLTSMACLSLASKLEEADVQSNISLLLEAGEPGFSFDKKTIQRMEILILNRLNWKIKAYTPCSFIDYYLAKISDGEFPSRAVIDLSLQVVVSTIEGIEFLQFRASEIAAAVAVFVCGDMLESIDIDNALSGLVGITKANVEKLVEMIKNLTTIRDVSSVTYVSNESLQRERRSPNGVLEAVSCLSYKSDAITVESSPSTKRKKLDQKPTVESGH